MYKKEIQLGCEKKGYRWEKRRKDGENWKRRKEEEREQEGREEVKRMRQHKDVSLNDTIIIY